MIFDKIKNLNYLLIFLLILISFIGAAGLYSAANGSYQPWASRHLMRFYAFLFMAIVISMIDIKVIYKYSYLLFLLSLLLLISVEIMPKNLDVNKIDAKNSNIYKFLKRKKYQSIWSNKFSFIFKKN